VNDLPDIDNYSEALVNATTITEYLIIMKAALECIEREIKLGLCPAEIEKDFERMKQSVEVVHKLVERGIKIKVRGGGLYSDDDEANRTFEIWTREDRHGGVLH
jgi:hypothetical protein